MVQFLLTHLVCFVFRVVEHSQRSFAYAIDYLVNRLVGKLTLQLMTDGPSLSYEKQNKKAELMLKIRATAVCNRCRVNMPMSIVIRELWTSQSPLGPTPVSSIHPLRISLWPL